MHLPTQLAEVDPIVASFCGGGVGVLTALLIVEANNAKMQARRWRCLLARGLVQDGLDVALPALHLSNKSGRPHPPTHPLLLPPHPTPTLTPTSTPQEKRRCIYCEGTGYLTCGSCVGLGATAGELCANCAGTGRVMCTSCLCTGKKLATEHDPRVDPFTLGMD